MWASSLTGAMEENPSKEIDFVVNLGDKRLYIQSAWQMNTEQKADSELDSLCAEKYSLIFKDLGHSIYDRKK